MNKKKVLVILGPTSTGKTDLSIEIAKQFNGEIISADSRQVYKELNLLSGKVTTEEMDGIPHHCLDIVNVGQDFSVVEYKNLAKRMLEEILERNKLPIIVGGTGFYIDALIYDIDFPEVLANHTLRQEMSHKTNDELFSTLTELDPVRAHNIDKQNPVRLIRAIEIAKALGSNPPAPDYTQSPYDPLFIGLDMPDEDLKNRMALRIDKRIESGMIVEAQSILDSGTPPKTLTSLGLDAKHSAAVAQDKVPLSDMKAALANDTWHYVKRQRTWWKRNKNILWFNPLNKLDTERIRQAVESFTKNN